MKNNNTNILSKILALLFTLQFHPLKSITMPWYQRVFNKSDGISYALNCEQINKIQNIHYILLLVYHCISNKKSHLDKVLIAIKNELAEIEQWILKQEQDALLAIKEKYQISNEIWQKYLADLNRMKTIFTKNMQKSHPDTIHDPNIPSDILETLTTLLQQNNINPHSIHLRMISDQAEIDENPNTIAHAANYISSFQSSKELTISYNYTPSAIELFPRMITEESIINKICTCAHEVQHIIQHHHLNQTLLVRYLHRHYNIDYEELKTTKEYHRFAQIHEAQAEILSAIKDPKIASYLKIKRETIYYPDHLYEEHFYHLAYINMLWKIHGWIEKLQTNDLNSVLYQALQIQLLNNCCRINTFKR